MSSVRTVVTGHDGEGRSIILSDATESLKAHRAGEASRVLWTTEGFPVDNDDATDRSQVETRTSEDDGTVFRVIRYQPGVTPRHHRTNSIDYAVVLSGIIKMVLDSGTVELRAGDCLVQRGTLHNWINDGEEDCVIAFVLIGAKPASTADGVLEPTG